MCGAQQWEVVREAGEVGTNKRPGDLKVFYFPGRAGAGGARGVGAVVSRTAYDVTVTATQHKTDEGFGFDAAINGPGHHAAAAAALKRRKYRVARAAREDPGTWRQTEFVPLVLESSGFMHAKMKEVVWKWEERVRVALQSQHEKQFGPGAVSVPWRCARRRLSSCVHYWNSISILSRLGADLVVRMPLEGRGGGVG